jgi:hypothetical protein
MTVGHLQTYINCIPTSFVLGQAVTVRVIHCILRIRPSESLRFRGALRANGAACPRGLVIVDAQAHYDAVACLNIRYLQ